MGNSAAKCRGSKALAARSAVPRDTAATEDRRESITGAATLERQDAGVQQLFVRGSNGRSIAVNADLDEDVVAFAQALAARDRKSRASVPSLRFTFGGQTLEPGVPLRKYGICKGSNILSLACPRVGRTGGGATFRSPWSRGSTPRHTPTTSVPAWEAPGRETPPSPSSSAGTPTTLFTPTPADVAKAQSESKRKSTKTNWVEIPVTITTPFAEVDGVLGYPEHIWESSRLSPRVLRRMVRVSDVLGIHAPREETISNSSWRLRMRDLHPFPCVQPPVFADIWQRLQATTARIEIWSPEEALLGGTRPLVNPDDEVHLGSVDRRLVGQLHVSVSLLKDAELAVDDVTVRFREPERPDNGPTSKEETCCVCLEPMLAGQMCRRLACLHCLHAGCAMTLLSEAPSCPVCRISIVHPTPLSSCCSTGHNTGASLVDVATSPSAASSAEPFL